MLFADAVILKRTLFVLSSAARVWLCHAPSEKCWEHFLLLVFHTLIDMHTELTAVPHAGLGYHFLKYE